MSTDKNFIDVSPEQGAAFFGGGDDRAPVMINLLRFRERADYSAAPDSEPSGGCSGRDAYERYTHMIEPLLKQSGGEILLSAAACGFLIGPPDERWDHVLVVRQASKAAFLGFASDPVAMAAAVHRSAALEDSRLLPCFAD